MKNVLTQIPESCLLPALVSSPFDIRIVDRLYIEVGRLDDDVRDGHYGTQTFNQADMGIELVLN